MKIRFCILFILLFASWAAAQPTTTPDPESITFEQRLGSRVPLDLVFTDENGDSVALQQYAKTPILLVLGYYDCPMLCSLVHNGMIEALNNSSLSAEELHLVSISIDPNENSALARTQKNTYLKRYTRRGGGDVFHFLVGEEVPIKSVANTIGFRYQYDKVHNEYAHASGFVVLTPEGVVSRYFYGVQFDSQELAEAVRTASRQNVSSPVTEFILRCFHYDPVTGRYGTLIMNSLRAGAFATLAIMAVCLVRWSRRYRTDKPNIQEIKG